MGQKIKSLLLQQQHFEHSGKPARQQTRRRHAAKATGRKPGGAPPRPPRARPAPLLSNRPRLAQNSPDFWVA